MCFSAEADLVAGTVVSVIGIDALRQVRVPRELALGSVPIVLGTHQLVEAVVWQGQSGGVTPETARTALWAYLLVALVVLPALVPAAVWAVEPEEGRRRVMAAAAGLGAAVAGLYLFSMVQGPIGVEVVGRHLAYHKEVPYGGWVAALYVVVVCAPLLVSSHRRIVAFGVANLLAVAVLDWLARTGLTSLWCAWAALTSIFIAQHLRLAHRADGERPVALERVGRGGGLPA